MASSRQVRDNDTALWLHNKLGSVEELWLSSSIGGIMRNETITNIYRCYPVLTMTVKMKLLLGILHLPRRSLEEMKHTINGLVELALDDMDQWVKLIGTIIEIYPMTFKLCLNLSSNLIAANVLRQLQEKVRDADPFATLPLECQYVNKNALQNLVGNQPPLKKHFSLKRKPKSAALRVDLMQKSTDASSQVKRGNISGFFGNNTVPVKHRDMARKLSDAVPMRSMPKLHGGASRSERFRSTPNTPTLSRTTSRYSGRQERGTKLLDISEQPVGSREAKRRKKQQELENPQLVASEEAEDKTPEYAVGLIPSTLTAHSMHLEEEGKEENTSYSQEKSFNDSSMEATEEEFDEGESSSAITMKADTAIILPDTSPAYSSNQLGRSSSINKKTLDDDLKYGLPATPSPFFKASEPPGLHDEEPSSPLLSPDNRSPAKQSSSSSPTKKLMSKKQQHMRPNTTYEKPTVVKPTGFQPPQPSAEHSSPSKVIQNAPSVLPTYASRIYHVAADKTMPSTFYSPNQIIRQPYQVQPQQHPVYSLRPPVMPPGTAVQPQVIRGPIAQVTNPHQQQQQQHHQQQLHQTVPKKSLTLTTAQANQAQELFRSANRIGRQERAIIMGFMAGSRDNPFPEKGHILQITLSEHEQKVQNTAGQQLSVLVETLVEMNYSTGSITKLQRLKQPNVVGVLQQAK